MKKMIILIVVFAAVAIFSFTFNNRNSDESPYPLGESQGLEVADEEQLTEENEHIIISPLSHATMVIEWNDTILYTDPVGGVDVFVNHPKPDIVLITDVHGDHMDADTLQGVVEEKTFIIAPQAVVDKLPEDFQDRITVLANNKNLTHKDFTIEAIPMYNLREEDLEKHVKGRGNGYVVEHEGTRVYFSGDTEDIPEMRALKNIDIAFVTMNLPYTMPAEKAADAVLEFAPAQVYPYHYRQKDGFGDVEKFKEIVNAGNPEIEVIQLDWYPKL